MAGDRKVFISSTFEDLKDCRIAAHQAINGKDGFYTDRMEDWGARPEAPAKFLPDRVQDSDVFVGILGWRYGVEAEDGVSITEHEFDTATDAGIPRLMFFRDDEFPMNWSHRESHNKVRKQETFVKKVRKSNIAVKPFSSPDDLRIKIAQSLENPPLDRPHPIFVDGKKRLDLYTGERTVVLSSPRGIRAIDLPLEQSQKSLKNLSVALSGMIGDDAPPARKRDSNLAIVPISEEDLDILRNLVTGAIFVEKSPIITQGAADFLSHVLNLLEQAKDILVGAVKETNEASGRYQPLVTAISALAAVISAMAAL